MNRIVKLISRIFLISIFFVLIISCNLPVYNASGIYINTDFNSKICCIETPHKPDTLILKEDGTFISDYFGVGKYEVHNQIESIKFHLDAQKINIHTTISNKLFQKTKICLSANTNHHYLKIE